jgi:hypothetical protein
VLRIYVGGKVPADNLLRLLAEKGNIPLSLGPFKRLKKVE